MITHHPLALPMAFFAALTMVGCSEGTAPLDGAVPDGAALDAPRDGATSDGDVVVADGGLEGFDAPADVPTAMGDAGVSSALPWMGGVNLAGAEFGGSHIPGRPGFDYIYPSNAEADYFIDAGFTVFRVPFRWARIQPVLGEALDADELGRLHALVTHITGRGAYALIDPHDYAHRDGAAVGSAELPDATLADLWTRLAMEFASDDHVLLGLMNEPNGLPAAQWLSAANASIAAIRAAGATNLILVPGVRWTGAHSWLSGGDDANGAVMSGVVDPADYFAFELHQYLDSDSSGTHPDCVRDTVGSERLVAATGWMRDHGYRAFLGEFAGGDNGTCHAGITDMLAYMRSNQDVWFGYTWFAAGPWWGDYMFSVEPRDGSPAPQEAWLLPYL